MILGVITNYIAFLQFGLASYLLINSLAIGIKAHQEKANLFFAAAGVFVAFGIFSSVLAIEKLAIETATLLIFPSFYSCLLFHKRDSSFRWNMLLHSVIPIGWLIVYLSDLLVGIEGLFDFVYLLSIIGYGWASIYEASKLGKNTYWNNGYLKTLYFGLMAVIAIRFLLPIFFLDVENYMLYFQLVLAVYFVLLSSFYIKTPKKNQEELKATNQLEEAINYEEQVKRKLRNAMQKDKAFLNPELTLNDLAAAIGIKPPELSNFINNNLGKNFNDFVNEYRVEEVKRLMSSPTTDPQATIMELAYEAGFNSKASFNRIFKQFAQMTPSQFKKASQQVI